MIEELVLMKLSDKSDNTILYIDDEEKNLTSFKAVFRKEYKVFVAKSAQDGIEIMEKYPIHLVITDQRMPNMTGVEFLERIVDKYPDVTRIILTGYSDVEAIIQAINKGQVFRYVTKPWRKGELKETIDNALEYHYLRQENHQLIENLRKTNQELDRFVYSAGHDLRAPIASLMGLLNLAKEENDVDQLHRYVNLKEKTVKKLNNFIQEIIDYSKNNRTEVEADTIIFQDFIQNVLNRFENYENATEINKILEIQQNCAFSTDVARLEIIFNNLISNAIRFSNSHQNPPFIKISVQVAEKEAIIQVIDNGIGIAEVHIPRIFEMFYRATDKKVGSGLGLFLAKEAIEKLEGSIEVQSVYGAGTTFTLKIPNLK